MGRVAGWVWANQNPMALTTKAAMAQRLAKRRLRLKGVPVPSVVELSALAVPVVRVADPEAVAALDPDKRMDELPGSPLGWVLSSPFKLPSGPKCVLPQIW